MWDKNVLQDLMKEKLAKYKFIIVSNRQPYVFDYVGRKVKCTKTIGGLVTAMDPVMQASEGVWVAASSGDADNSVIDKNNIVKVPPEKSAYSMKLINLTKNEEQGYYYGYSNQALWPLSHIAYRQPNFMHSDWETYKNVNKRFAESVFLEWYIALAVLFGLSFIRKTTGEKIKLFLEITPYINISLALIISSVLFFRETDFLFLTSFELFWLFSCTYILHFFLVKGSTEYKNKGWIIFKDTALMSLILYLTPVGVILFALSIKRVINTPVRVLLTIFLFLFLALNLTVNKFTPY